MKTWKNVRLHWGPLLGAAILILVHACSAFAQTSNSPAPVLPVPNPCPRFAPGSVVHQPPALYSQNGALAVQFSYQTVTDSANRTLFCFMTPSGLENPTLHIKPGDHLIITVTNNTTAGAFMMMIDPPNCGPGGNQMTMSSLNIHYHGTNTSPTCGQDEVIKTLINYGQTFQYNVAFPTNEPPGLYWYHPHIHGIAEPAVLGGASGAIVVEGIEDVQPAVSELPQRILILRDQPTVQSQQTPPVTESPGGDPNGVPFQDLTVNNITTNTTTDTTQNPYVTTYTPAVLNMQTGDREFWRISNSSSDSILDLQVQYDGVPQTVQIVEIDGVAVNSQEGPQPPATTPATHFRLPPASRVEFIVNAPAPTVKLAQLVTLNILTGQNGDDDPYRPIFNIKLVAEDDEVRVASNHLSQFTALNPNQKRFAGLATAPVAIKRLVYFNEVQPTQFFMDVQGVPEKQFDPNAAPAITATQGTVEEWTVENHTLENHEFHFHQLHFLLESQNNFKINNDKEAPDITGQMLDMVEVPNWDGNPAHPFPSVTLRIDFRGSDIGDFVFHCHILNHEDLGMMNIIRVQQSSSSADSRSSTKSPNPTKPVAPVADSKPSMMKMNR